MENPDAKPDYKRIYAYVRECFNKTSYFSHGPFDETFYSLMVYESAKKIISQLDCRIYPNIDLQPLLTACLLHDIGKIDLNTSIIFSSEGMNKNVSEEWNKHAKLGVPIAKKYLESLGHSTEFIEKVCYLIEHHPLRGELMKDRTLELKILQDADLIADIGYAGFIRPFLYSGMFEGQSIIDSIKFLSTEDRTSNGNHLNLDISKTIAKQEMELQKNLAFEISKKIQSDLILD